MDFKTLIAKHKDYALQLDAKKVMPATAYRMLQKHKLKLESAESESEFQETMEVLKKAEKGLKNWLLQSILNGNYRTPDDYFFSRLKGYLEYKSLNDGMINQPEKTELTLKQIALLYIYKSEYPTDADSIAKKYGHTSGQKLMEHYAFYRDRTDRNSSGSKRKDNSLKNDIEKIIPLLPKEKRETPQKEAEKLKNKVENDDYQYS